MKNTKDKWRTQVRTVSRVLIHSILKNQIGTKNVRINIIGNPLIGETKVLHTVVPTYRGQQKFVFYIKDSEICLYEENMSRRNSDRSMEIQENRPIKSLDDQKIENYEEAIVAFIMANIVWNE